MDPVAMRNDKTMLELTNHKYGCGGSPGERQNTVNSRYNEFSYNEIRPITKG